MPNWLGFRLKFILVCALWIGTCDYLIHGVLLLPRFSVHQYLYGFYGVLLLGGVISASYSITYVILFLIPWVNLLVLSSLFFNDSARWITIVLLIFTLVGFLYYLKRSVIDSRNEILGALDRIIKGSAYDACRMFFFDERGRVMRNLNLWLSSVRERFRLTQFISTQEWHEISTLNPRYNSVSQDCWTISLVFCWRGQSSFFDETILAKLTSYCSQLNGSINRFHAGQAELIFQEDSVNSEKNILVLLPELRTLSMHPDEYLFVAIRRSFLKRGVVMHPDGYSFRFVGYSLVEDLKFLNSQNLKGVNLWVHSSVASKARQMFHLDEAINNYHHVRSDKDLEYHFEKLASPKVEERLISIRVVSIQKNRNSLIHLLNLLHDVSPRVRIATAGALGILVNEDSEDTIGSAFLEALQTEWNQDIRASLVMSLGKLRKPSLVKPLYDLLSDENDRVRANAVEAVGRCMGRNAVVRHVEKLLKDPNNRTRANAAMAIWLVGDKRGFITLVEMASSEDPMISCSGLYGIGEIFTNENIKISIQFIADPVKFYFKEKSLFENSLQTCIEKSQSEHPLVEMNAVIALGKLRSNKSVVVLHKKFLQTSRPSVQQAIIQALIQLEEFELVSSLRKELVEAE